MSALVHEYPCGIPGCKTLFRSTSPSAAYEQLLRHQKAHRDHVVMHIQTGSRPGEAGRISPWLLFPVTLSGLFFWGWTHSSARPNGATLLAILCLAAAGTLLVILGKTIRGYWVLEEQDAEHTEQALENMRQNRLTLITWDHL